MAEMMAAARAEMRRRRGEGAASSKRKRSGRVLGIEIVEAEVVIEVEAEQTVYELVRTACAEWLVKVRPYDGEVTEHLWTVRTGSVEFFGPWEEGLEGFDGGLPQVFAADAGRASARAAFPSVGSTARFDYDLGSPSAGVFELAYETDAVAGVEYPRVVVVQSEDGAVPAPLDVERTADDMFPHLSALLFHHHEDVVQIGRWSMFRSTKDVMAFAEDVAGANDVVFAPAPGHRYRSAADLFRAMDYACDPARLEQRDWGGHSSLFVFCADPMPRTSEAKLAKAMNAPVAPFDDAPILFLREPVAERDAALADIPFDDTFPNTAAAFRSHRWFEYKHRLQSLKLCQGPWLQDRDVIPTSQVIAKLTNVHFQNLHALLSAVEGLWP